MQRPRTVIVSVLLGLAAASCGSDVLVQGGGDGSGGTTGTGTAVGTSTGTSAGAPTGSPVGTTTGTGSPAGTTTGTGTYTGSPAGTTTGTGTYTGSPAGTTTGTGSPAGTPPGTSTGWTGCNIGNCQACANSSCAMYQCEAQWDACFMNPMCIELINCYQGCGFAPDCIEDCDSMFAPTVNILSHALLWCTVCSPATCSQDCAGVPFCMP